MKTITVSVEKIQEILQSLQAAKAGKRVDLSAHLPYLIAVLESLLTLLTALVGGCSIVDLRKLFGIKLSKNKLDHDSSRMEQEAERKGRNDCQQNTDLDEHSEQENSGPDQQNNGKAVKAQPSSDDLTDVKPKKKNNANHPGKACVDDYPDAKTCQHYHEHLKPGDVCPECGKGKLYLDRPRMQILFTGSPPIIPVKHRLNDLRCGLCKASFPAKPNEEASSDGLGREDRYGYSAIAMIVLMKYFSDLPLYRNQRLHGMHGINLAASSQFDQAEKLANALQAIDKVAALIAAKAYLYMADDATGRILSKTSEFKADRTTGKLILRHGCHSSVVIAFDQDRHPLVRIRTDIIHAGEWLDEILKARPANIPKPMIMWDRCSTNSVTACGYTDLGCNQHARQNFKDQLENYPTLIRPILDAYKHIFRNDAQTVAMMPRERLAFHKQHSGPTFDSILTTCRRVFEDKLIPPNSEIAQPFQYVINHEKALRGFLEHEAAPVSNNLTERTILYLVLLRNNVHFFKTLAGARVADMILSLGLSAFYLGVNLFHYFRLVMACQEEVRKNPAEWLPWTFLERYPQYEIKYKSRRRSWPPDSKAPFTALTPPR